MHIIIHDSGVSNGNYCNCLIFLLHWVIVVMIISFFRFCIVTHYIKPKKLKSRIRLHYNIYHFVAIVLDKEKEKENQFFFVEKQWLLCIFQKRVCSVQCAVCNSLHFIYIDALSFQRFYRMWMESVFLTRPP